jgi:hypothetical protein
MLENATRTCAAKFGILYQCEGDALRTVAIHGAPQSFVEERQRNPIVSPNPDTTLGRALSPSSQFKLPTSGQKSRISMPAPRNFQNSLAPELFLRSPWSRKTSCWERF